MSRDIYNKMNITESDADMVIRNIFDGIKDVEGLRYDTDIADVLNTSKSRVNQWKARKTIPFEDALLWSKNNNISMSWLLLRRGNKYLEGESFSGVKEEGLFYSSNMNREIMADVIEVVLEELAAQGKTLPPEKMAQLMLLIHDEIQESEQVDKNVNKAKVIRLINLAS